MKTPWIVAHRGGAGHAPENTLAAFEKSVALGARFIETDLHVTRDARFVAIHDSTLNRTTNGEGAIRELTLEQVRLTDAGQWYDRSYAGQRVPTLEEVLQFAQQHDVVFYLELKYDASSGMAPAFVETLWEGRAISRTVVISFDPAAIVAIRDLDASVLTGLLVEDAKQDVVKAALVAGARQLCPQFSIITPELVEQAHHSDLSVVAWTVNQREEMDAMIAAGVDGIITDFPDRLRAVIEHLQGTTSGLFRDSD